MQTFTEEATLRWKLIALGYSVDPVRVLRMQSDPNIMQHSSALPISMQHSTFGSLTQDLRPTADHGSILDG